MRVLTQQPQGKSYVDRNNRLGRDITFLWSGADSANDSANNIFVGGGVNAQLITTASSDRGKVLFTSSTGAITWRLYDIASTNYLNYSGPIRNAAVWSQGIVFKYRNAATSSEMFQITNGGAWNHLIYVDSNGFVQVRNPSWTAGVFLTSDNSLTLGSWVSVVVVWQSGNTRFYVNGVLQTQTNTQAIYTAGLDRVHFSPVGIDILTAFAANTGWTSEDALSWHNNPWQLFKTQTSIREKLSQQFHFTDLLPTYPGLSNIRIPNRDSRGMFVPKIPNKSLAGGTNALSRNPIKYWYTLPNGNVYVSSIDHSNKKGVYEGVSQAHQTPYGVGLDETNNYEFNTDGKTISGTTEYSSNQTLVGLFYLHNVGKLLTNNRRPSLLGVRSYRDGAPYTAGLDGIGAYWKNDAGERAILVGTDSGKNITPFEIPNIPNGLHCLVLVYKDGLPVKVYLNGKKVSESTTVNNVYPQAYSTRFLPSLYWAGISKSREDVGTILFNGAIQNKAFEEYEAIQLSKDPYSYFFKDAYTNKHNLLRSLTFDVPQAITRSSYVQTANMPRKFVPVNRARPLTRGIKFASGPAWGDRDAADPRIRYSEIPGYRQMTRFGEAFLPGAVGFSQSASDTIVGGGSSHTLMFIGCIELDEYPNGSATYPDYLGVDWGDNNSFQFRVDANGRLRVGIQNNAGQPRYLTGSHEVFPLRKLGVAISVVEAGVGTTLYINGKYAGFSTFAAGTNTTGQPRRVGYAIPNTNLYGKQYLACGWVRALSFAEVQQISENPWQIFESKLTDPLPEKLLSIAADYPLIYTPTTSTRYIPLSTPSLVDRSNPLSKDIAFAGTPVHSNRDAVNSDSEILLGNDLELRFLTGRGGLAWNMNRYHDVDVVTKDKKNSANWTLFCVFSLETNSHAEIPAGYFLTGPSWGDNSIPKLMSTDAGYLSFGQYNNYVLVSKDVVPLRKLTTAMLVGTPAGTKLYMNGQLQASVVTAYNTPTAFNPRYMSYSDSAGPPSAWRPWLIYMSCGWYRALSDIEIQLLSQDPLKLFKRPDTTNHKILQGQYKYVETDANGRWTPYTEQPAYVNYAKLPRSYVPVNKAHPLAYKMLYCTTPAHGTRDAYHQDMQWEGPTGVDFSYSYNIGTFSRYGLAWKMKPWASRRSQYFTKLPAPSPRLQLTSYTMLQFLSIEQDTYPIQAGDRGLMGTGFANSLHLRLGKWGAIHLDYAYYNRGVGSFPGVVRVPLRKLVAVAVSVTPNDVSLYMDGKLVGYSNTMNSSLLPFDIQETGGGGGYVLALGNHASPQNHDTIFVYLSATWRRALNSAEILEMSRNPGQIFQQPSKFKNRYAEAVEAVLDISRKFLLFFG